MKKITNLFLPIILISLSSLANAQTAEVKPIETVQDGNSKSAAEFYAEAYDYYDNEEYDQALKSINKALNIEKNNLDFYNLKCYIFIKLKDNKGTIETATKALTFNKRQAEFYELRGNTYYFDFQPEKALEDYRKMLDLDQSITRYYNNYLKLLNEQRKDDEMMKVFGIFEKNIKQIKAKNSTRFMGDVYFYSALAATRQENTDKAIKLYTEAINISDDAEMYYNNRGIIYSDLKQYDLALKDLTKAIELDPEDASKYETRAMIYLDMKDYNNAQKDFLNVLRHGTDRSSVYLNLANSYQMQGNYTAAIENYLIALKKSPENAGVMSNLAYAYFDSDKMDEAANYFEKAFAKDPQEIDILVGLAVIYSQKNKTAESKKILDKIATSTKYKAARDLLTDLSKDGYIYTDHFTKAWKKLF